VARRSTSAISLARKPWSDKMVAISLGYPLTQLADVDHHDLIGLAGSCARAKRSSELLHAFPLVSLPSCCTNDLTCLGKLLFICCLNVSRVLCISSATTRVNCVMFAPY
jgi:hypothetical protein